MRSTAWVRWWDLPESLPAIPTHSSGPPGPACATWEHSAGLPALATPLTALLRRGRLWERHSRRKESGAPPAGTALVPMIWAYSIGQERNTSRPASLMQSTLRAWWRAAAILDTTTMPTALTILPLA